MNKLFCSTWCQKFDDLSNNVDLVTISKLVDTVESPAFIVGMFNFFRRDVEPVMTNSVFSLFSWSL